MAANRSFDTEQIGCISLHLRHNQVHAFADGLTDLQLASLICGLNNAADDELVALVVDKAKELTRIVDRLRSDDLNSPYRRLGCFEYVKGNRSWRWFIAPPSSRLSPETQRILKHIRSWKNPTNSEQTGARL
jgi:hypothetical protein